MNREQLLSRIKREWQGFQKSYEELGHAALTTPGVTGLWSVRDVLTHVTTWEEEALKSVPVILEGGRLPRYSHSGGIDAFNSREQDRKRGLTLDQIMQEQTDTHGRLTTFLVTVPESAYASENRLIRRLRWDTYGHYREHAAEIVRWREELQI